MITFPEREHIKSHGHSWIMNEITKQARAAGIQHHTRVLTGLVDLRVKRYYEEGIDFYNIDHSYFQRGWHLKNFRAIRNHNHLREIKKRPDDRMKMFGVKIEPWRRNRGSKIYVIPITAHKANVFADSESWLKNAVRMAQKATGRSIIYKNKDAGPLSAHFDDMWALICNGSVAGMEAALAGIPVFAGPHCCSLPVSAGDTSNIENPELVDFRHEWASSLAYSCWNQEEIDTVNWLNYDYELRNDLSR